MPTAWWQRKSMWAFVCVASGLALLQANYRFWLNIIGVVLIALGIALSFVRYTRRE